jgi:hypothetical protein
MSGLSKGRVLPEKGNEFSTSDEHSEDRSYVVSISQALHRQLGDTHQATKTVMRWTGAGERTVKNWFAATAGPSGANLIALMRSSDDVWSTVLELADRRSAGVGVRLLVAREKLVEALKAVDAVIDL